MLNPIFVKRVTLKNNYKIRNWFEKLMSQVHIIIRYSSNEKNGRYLFPWCHIVEYPHLTKSQ